MKRFARKPSRSVLVAIALVLALASAAAGYWSGAGTGTTSTKLADAVPVTLSPGTPGDPIAPGGVADVEVVISNPNGFEAHTSTLMLDDDANEPFTVDGAHLGCDVSVLSLVAQTNGGAGWNVPPKVGSSDGILVVHLDDALAMSSAASDSCQGALFTIAMDARI